MRVLQATRSHREGRGSGTGGRWPLSHVSGRKLKTYYECLKIKLIYRLWGLLVKLNLLEGDGNYSLLRVKNTQPQEFTLRGIGVL